MKHTRGFVGIGILCVGIFLTIPEQTRPISWVIIGFGLGMISSGFKR